MPTICNEKTSPTATMDDRGFLQYTRTFEVIFESRTLSNPNSAFLALPIQKFDSYSYAGFTDNTSKATTVTATPDNDGLTYTVTVNYTTPEQVAKSSESGSGGQPTKAWSYTAYTDVLKTDLDNRDIRNSAGDLFPEGLETQRFIPVLTITRTEPTFSPLKAFQYMGSINVGIFYGAAKGTVRCTDFSGSLGYNQDGTTFYTVTYSFEFGFFPHGQGWDSIVLDEGYYYLDNTLKANDETVEVKRRILIATTNANDPQKLNGQGQVLSEGGVGYFLKFRIHPYANFTSLGLE